MTAAAASVPLLVVRHAVALSRRKWDGADSERPLTARGARQAEALVGMLADFRVERVLSSPATRCVDTVAPLAKVRGLKVETPAELAEGSTRDAVRLLASLTDVPSVLCSHGDVIPYVLEELVRDGADIGAELHAAKGSVWVLEAEDGYIMRGQYLHAPD